MDQEEDQELIVDVVDVQPHDQPDEGGVSNGNNNNNSNGTRNMVQALY